VDATADGIGGLAIGAVLDELNDGDQGELPGWQCGLSAPGVELGEVGAAAGGPELIPEVGVGIPLMRKAARRRARHVRVRRLLIPAFTVGLTAFLRRLLELPGIDRDGPQALLGGGAPSPRVVWTCEKGPDDPIGPHRSADMSQTSIYVELAVHLSPAIAIR
jgi:hypothetical protein